MDTLAKLIICAILGAFYAPVATAYNLHGPEVYDNLQIVDGDLHIKRPGGGTSHVWPDIKINKEIPVNTSKGNYLVPVEKTFPVEPSKVGKAATRFLKTLPAIGTAIALYDTVCDLSDICLDGDALKYRVNDDETKYRNVIGGYWSIYSGSRPGGTNMSRESFDETLDNTKCGPTYLAQNPSLYCTFEQVLPMSSGVGYYYRIRLYSTHSYTMVILQHHGDYEFGPSDFRPVTESDWTAAEPKLNAQPQQTATALFNSDAPVPVQASTQFAPVTQQIAQTSTQTKDAQGNITGTQVATTSVKVEDISTTNNITYNITETTTITTYNDSNEITGTQTSTSDNQPPEKPPGEQEDITMDHGGVPEIPLLTQTIDVQEELDNAEQPSWSGGTCPPDIDLGIYDLEFSLTPFCNFADNLRPIVLMLGAFLSFFILSGAKFD